MLARRIAVTSLFLGQGMHIFLSMQVYRAGENPKFPDGGKMSCHLDSMQIGDTIEAKGPMGHFTYSGRGMCVALLPYSRLRITVFPGLLNRQCPDLFRFRLAPSTETLAPIRYLLIFIPAGSCWARRRRRRRTGP